MRLVGFGFNHKTAPFELLERVSFTPDGMLEMLASLCSSEHIDEAFGISTCNRTEFVLLTSDVQQSMALLALRLRDRKGVQIEKKTDKSYFYTDEDAVRHLFQVACGIDSLVVGENEILGQLRRAREAASDAGHIGDGIDPLLIRAIDVGRRARQTTAISRGNVSVASVAATLASRTLGDLDARCGIILGAGKTAEVAAIQMAERGMKDLIIVNRTLDRAQHIASSLGAREASLEELGNLLDEADVVVCATGATNYVVTLPMMERALRRRKNKEIMLLDVSVPRNIDPAAGSLPGVHLYGLEDLSQLAEENRRQRETQMLEVNEFIEQELAAWSGLQKSADSGRLIGALHRQLEHVRKEYVRKNAHHFAADQREQLELFSSGLTRSLLHDVIENLRGINLETTEGRRRYEIARELLNVSKKDN